MSDFDEAAQLARANRPAYTDLRIKVSGYLDPATGAVGVDPTEGAQPGYMWVHGYPRGANTQVIAGTAINPYLPNQRVRVGQNEAGQAVAFEPVIDRNSLEQFGAVLPALNQPSGADELLPRSILGLGFVPGRVEASQKEGLYVHVRSFFYQGGAWDGDEIDYATGKPTVNDFDLAPYITVSTPDFSQWVAVYLDSLDDTLHAVALPEVYGAPNTLRELDLLDVPLPYGAYPLGAVGIAYGQTDIIGASRFADMRLHLSTNGVTQTDWNRIVVDADGAVVADADGNVVVSA